MTHHTGQSLVREAKDAVPAVSCQQLQELRDEGIDYVLLDVRTQEEYDEGHIEDALHIPRGFLEMRVEEQIPDRDTRIILCCGSGGRSALAGQTLQQMGYTKVAYLDGGYTEYCR